MINLFISYYVDKSLARQKELDECLKKNIENPLIKTIYVLVQSEFEGGILDNEKIIQLLCPVRPTYNIFFEAIRMFAKDDEWSIISNTDIYFDDSLKNLDKYKTGKPVCFALTRYEILPNMVQFLNRADSQDCWIIKGKPRHIEGNFCLGVCGCDNAIADRLMKAGYNVINPSLTIKTYHLHLSGIRNYNVNEKVKQPYKLLQPTV